MGLYHLGDLFNILSHLANGIKYPHISGGTSHLLSGMILQVAVPLRRLLFEKKRQRVAQKPWNNQGKMVIPQET